MKYKVLLVEDEPGIANAFKKQLELIAGYTVTWVDRGDKALEAVKNDTFDVILLDLVMPEFDGIYFLKNYTQSTEAAKRAPVIVLSNVSSTETKEEVDQFHVSKYIVKTDITPDELISVIEEVAK